MKSYLLVNLLFCVFPLIASCQNSEEIQEEIIKPDPQETPSYVPENYELTLSDDFEFFNTEYWSKGLTHDTNPEIKMVWNKSTGGENLLNDNYAGYLLDKNVYTNEGYLYLVNEKEKIQGVDPAREFDYSTGWMNSLQKINFNGSNRGVYLEIKAKFPKGPKVWPAVWLVDDSENRGWPPEVDIWEYFGKFFNTKHTDQMYMRYIYGKWNDKHDHSIPLNNFQENYKSSSEWHVYGYQWTPTKMMWFIDGELVHTKTKGVEVPVTDWPDLPMCLIINNGLLTVVDEGETTFPNSLILDNLKIYQHKN